MRGFKHSVKDFWKDLSSILQNDGMDRKSAYQPKNTVKMDHLCLDYPQLSSLLPYRYYWSDKALFVNEGSMGFGCELTILAGADEKVVQALDDWLCHKVPDHYDIQFILWSSSEVGDAISKGLISQNNTPIFEKLNNTSIAYYKHGAQSGFKNHKNYPITLRDYRLFCFVSKQSAYDEQLIGELDQIRRELLSELKSIGLYPHILDDTHFLKIIAAWVNPDTNQLIQKQITDDQHDTLNHIIVDRSFELQHEPNRLCVSMASEEHTDYVNTEITNLSVRRFPEKYALWMGADNFVNVFRATQAITCPFLISVSFRLVPKEIAKTQAQRRFLDLDKKARSVYAKYIAGTSQTAEEWKRLRDQLSGDNTRLVKTFYNVVLFSKPGHAEADSSDTISCFRYNGIELFNTKYMQLQSYLASMPFLLSEGLHHDLKRIGRLKTLTTWNLANLLPLVSDYKLSRRGVLLHSFRHQVSFFNLFDDRLPITNYNAAIAATSGAGKSFLTQSLINNTLKEQGIVYVIDLGDSYQKYNQMLGGTYLTSDCLALNPFTQLSNIHEQSEQIRDLLAIMASPHQGLDDVQEAYLRKSVIDAWEIDHDKTTIDSVVKALQRLYIELEYDYRIRDLITLLEPYTTTGAYGQIFNQHSNITENKSSTDFVVLEMGGLNDKPALMKAVLFALILRIEQDIYQKPRSLQKMVVIDEAWRLLSGDNQAASRFIEKGYRTGRKHNTSFITITQGIEDFHRSQEAKACWNCSDTKIIMRQNAKAFEDFMHEHENYFDPYTVSLIKRFGEAKQSGFSEFMLQLGQLQTFNRLFVDPYSRILFSSAADDSDAVAEYVRKGLSLADAVLEVAKLCYPDEWSEQDDY